MVTRLLVVDHHQLMIDTLSAWFRCSAPDLVVAAGLNVVPELQHELHPEPLGAAPSWANPAWADPEITVAILGTLDLHTELIPAVHRLVDCGLRVVVLATRLDGWEAGAALAAGALGYVPKSAGPRHTELAVRAASAGQEYFTLTPPPSWWTRRRYASSCHPGNNGSQSCTSEVTPCPCAV